MKKIAVLLSMLIICCSFIGSFLITNDDDQMSFKDQIAVKVINETAKTIEKKYKFHPIGTAMSGMGKFRSLGIEFQVRGALSKNEARKIIIDCIDKFLLNINSNEKLKPFLSNYPFKPENISIVLYIDDSFGRELFHPEVSIVGYADDRLTYKTLDPENEYRFKDSYDETYEEAFQLVHKNE